jgi:PAS domain S-box-containing protein
MSVDIAGESSVEVLRRSEHNFRILIERSPFPTCVTSMQAILYANRAMLDYLGYDADGLIGPTLAELSDELIHPDDREGTRAAFANLFARLDAMPTQTVHIDDVRIRTRRGELRYCDMHGIVIRHDDTPALVTYLHDHTERRTAMEQLRFADRMSALGTLAAGVAHEINNPLTYVMANLEVVAAGLDQPELAIALADARTGVDRIRRIVRALRTFTRSNDDTTSVELADVLASTIDMAHSHLRHRGRVIKRYANAPRVRGSEARLGQVFLNLLLNAAQAFDEARADRNQVVIDVETRGDRAIVTVRDNGAGIAPADLPRVFDAFFTTKPIGVGTGLGLFVCHGIVTGLGGTIEISSARGEWTRVRVTLPLADERSLPATAPAETRSPTRGRVLVIDDDPLVLGGICRILEAEHDVTGVGTGQAALDAIATGPSFDLVLCDIVMPGMNGIELYAVIHARFPELTDKLVFMSGGAVTEAAAAFVARTANVVVDKPFEPDALLALVRARAR